ncbi:CGNR zinc finger domain-containing protein [Actinomadura flavalba]|uniref:CGNR zinc finger domain-containing protein n=1 Tax=Actinomadura flavalba TaxID=1120938 RepID=UPI0003634F83|nr:CGNR zinc finger domain-containing protein [Actinomadura flavalba]
MPGSGQETGYRSAGLAAAVALVNAVVDGADGADALAGLLRDHGFAWREFDAAEHAAGLREWGRTLRSFFALTDVAAAVALLNGLLLAAPLRPHLTDHDGGGLHLHFAPPAADLPERVRAATVMRLAELVCAHGLDRTGVCAAGGCERVYADASRSGRRRFCSEACANRTNVAAFRARRRTR